MHATEGSRKKYEKRKAKKLYIKKPTQCVGFLFYSFMMLDEK
jgi:hypothetical protein